MQFLKHPVLVYLLISIVSTVCALILFAAGGSLAEVTSSDNQFLGFGFRAGGALAGFLIIFMLSVKVMGKLKGFDTEAPVPGMSMKFHLKGSPEPFHKNESYTGTVSLFDEDTGDKEDLPVAEFRWENRSLTVDIPSVKKTHLVAISVRNSGDKVWECEYFHARARTTSLELSGT